MRLNRLIALQPGMSRRAADSAIAAGRIAVNGRQATMGQQVSDGDRVTLDGQPLAPVRRETIMLHKPAGFVCSRRGQGAPTIYSLLPEPLRDLKPAGRLDKDSSGLLILTNDGDLSQRLIHPSAGKLKTYAVTLASPLTAAQQARLQSGVELEDGPSRLDLRGSGRRWTVDLQEGRNRQIRRTFAAVGQTVETLHRLSIDGLRLNDLAPGAWRALQPGEV